MKHLLPFEVIDDGNGPICLNRDFHVMVICRCGNDHFSVDPWKSICDKSLGREELGPPNPLIEDFVGYWSSAPVIPSIGHKSERSDCLFGTFLNSKQMAIDKS